MRWRRAAAGDGSDETRLVVHETILVSLRKRQETNVGHAAVDNPAMEFDHVSTSYLDLSRVLQGTSRRNAKAFSRKLIRDGAAGLR
jgi:hypothetical protein